MTVAVNSLAREAWRILKPYWKAVLASIVMGVVSGLSVTALLATINHAMNQGAGPTARLALQFAGFCALTLGCSTGSRLLTNYVGQRVVRNLRRELAGKVLAAPVEQLERFRGHRLIPILLNDVTTISTFALSVAPMVIAFTVTLACLCYLALLSWQILLLTVLTVLIGVGAQYVAQRGGNVRLTQARDGEDELQGYYQAITDGAKELRIQRPRRWHMRDQLIHGVTERIAQANIRAANIFITAETFGSVLFFAVIGLAIAFQVMWPAADRTVLGGFVLVMLYMKGPLEQLVLNLPMISRARIALGRVAELSSRFSTPETQAQPGGKQAVPEFQHIELCSVRYDYPVVEGSEPFCLGPVNLRIERGDILFIVGENGCGKTSLIKLLLGLYPPQAGDIQLNGQSIGDAGRDDYRQLFTTIFADHHLFDDLSPGARQKPELVARYLQRLDIAHKVSLVDGSYSTTALSTGQRKRLALVNAWLDERPILVFDEWAADQDPTFRHVFYTELLPELKREGRTVVVISHDDRYFHVADQLIRMDKGRVASERVDNPALQPA
ncbi:putative ATP-binding cassette transporter [Pseudomonas sp. JUb42]|jgi:putative ATP-binding cassette transporter|uniref:cyclic peptide export ABC transporter n=1 Tax=Pseudomonas sp. JUb42 TaxID=2940611 RepID=UPI002167BD07|nr:cyclic peptide export ABC transporter [Pseudomonas sp. JUb42]MCS3472374.1 putative ATP-binding cassette transporter [Pseudomonas sp. JUb42]